MKRLAVGILAHVDSGKTTLSEGLLYEAGEIVKMGRVDHKDAFLDTDVIERERGITIFSKQAMLRFGDTSISLLDTPGHVDFGAETERVLWVLDYAILVISGSDGVQSHTQTLWKLLKHYSVPVFIFVNKMDLAGADKNKLMGEIQEKFGEGCIDFSKKDGLFYENAAILDSELLEEYLEKNIISEDSLQDKIMERKLFPCYFGSALKMDGVGEFLREFDKYTKQKKYSDAFGAKVFKISDAKGNRLTYAKITGGKLRVKDIINESKERKINEIRIYSGAKYKSVSEAEAGDVCALTGLSETYPGQGLGSEMGREGLLLEPVYTYSVSLDENTDINTALTALKKLAEEETQMKVSLNERMGKINVQIMGEVQLEVLKRILAERFSINAEFENGSIIYKETITDTVEGVGHYEPLRHYAEVHLLLEPAERGKGLVFLSKCSEDVLDRNWQRLIMTHLAEKTHIGVLTGSPITDMKITLINGRAHIKHTEGGDFRQATYRAIRQGLMQAKSQLLEPYYNFNISVPSENIGRTLNDLQQMGAEFEPPQINGDIASIKGSASVAKIGDYHKSIIAYTHGQGRLGLIFKGYDVCKNADEVIKSIGYNAENDTLNTADSVFCSHGSGYSVKWNKVFEHMHLEGYKPEHENIENKEVKKASSYIADEEELLRIFEKTYGKIQRRMPDTLKTPKIAEKKYVAKKESLGLEYLLIDGYNIIFACEDLKSIASENLDDARILLINRVCNYQALKKNNVILVFDAYKVKGMRREVERVHGISVVYTKEAETADAYIEKTSHELCKKYRVRVATSDNLEQIIVFGHGARRVSAREFMAEVIDAEDNMRKFIEENKSTIDG